MRLRRRSGASKMADKGALFLDEVGDLPPALEPKLLRVLQEREFERLGSGRTHKVDVRLVAATNQNLVKMVARGQFRSDLFYRLNVFPILLPALRERREDIPALVAHFVKLFSRRMGKQVDSIAPETMAAFQWYSWPGNIRELQNLVERAVILSLDGVLPNPLHKTCPLLRILSAIVFLSAVALVACRSERPRETPSISLTKSPPAAQGGRERVDTFSGSVAGARPKQQIVIYAHSGPWWVQPWPPYLGS